MSARKSKFSVVLAQASLMKRKDESVHAIVTEGPIWKLAHEVDRVLLPGGHLVCRASVSEAMVLLNSGILEFRGGIIRIAHEPIKKERDIHWRAERFCLFRKVFDGTVADCLRKHGTGGLRRESTERPFTDVHPIELPAFLTRMRLAVLPFGNGVLIDPFEMPSKKPSKKKVSR